MMDFSLNPILGYIQSIAYFDFYRFMPEPNLPPLRLVDQIEPSTNHNILNVAYYRKILPELPHVTRNKLTSEYELSADHAYRLLEDPILLEYFYEIIQLQKNTHTNNANRYAKMASQLLFCDLENIRAKRTFSHINELHIRPWHVARAAEMKADRELSPHLIREALDLIMSNDKYRNMSLDEIVNEQGWLEKFRDKERIENIVKEAIQDNRKIVGKYVRGNSKGFDNIVRNIFKKHGHDLDPNLVRTELKEQLEHLKSLEK